MEWILVLLGVAVVGALLLVPVLVIWVRRLAQRTSDLEAGLRHLSREFANTNAGQSITDAPAREHAPTAAATSEPATAARAAFAGIRAEAPVSATRPAMPPPAAAPPLPAAPAPAIPTPATPPRAARADLETVIGTRWLVFAGAGALFLGVAFLLKWSFDRGWFGPLPRVLGGATLGVALWCLGWFWRARYRVLAHGFAAGGSCALYASAWAAHMLWDLLPHGLSFAAMVAITAATLFGAARLNALALAVLALVGGFLTPALLPAESAAPHALLAYAGLLATAALLLRWLRGWPLLGPLALAGSSLLLLGWAAEHRAQEQHAALLLWGTGFVLLLGGGACGPALRRRAVQHALDLAVAVGGGLLWLLLVVALEARDDSKLAAVLAGAQALGFGALAWQTARRVPDDRRARESLWLAASVLVAATAPLALQRHALTVSLAAIGLLFVRSAGRLGARSLDVVGLAALGWAIVRAALLREEVFAEQWDGVRPVAAEPFQRLSCWIELTVVAAVAGLGWVRTAWRERALTCAAVMLLPILTLELMGVLVANGWPHDDVGFDRAIAVAVPPALLAVALALLQPAAGRAIASLAALAGAGGLLASAIGTQAAAGAWTRQYACLIAPLLFGAVAAGRSRGSAAPRASAAVIAIALCYATTAIAALELGRLWRVPMDPEHPGPAMFVSLAAGAHGLALLARPRPFVGLLPATLSSAVWAPVAMLVLALLGQQPPVLLREGARYPFELAAAVVPFSFVFLLPAALGAVLLHRGLRLGTAAGLASCVAAGLALLAWDEVEGPIAAVPVWLVLPLSAAVALLLAILGPGSLRGRGAALGLPCVHLVVLLLLLSREAWRLGATMAADAEQGAHTALSVCWALCAVAALLAGILARVPVLRRGALGLFGLTLGKLVVVDLAALPLPFRVLSFLALGATLMGGGWLYHRFAGRIRAGEGARD